ncbi:MAG: PilZ domain-containing protein [Syntrophobacterales bacterium]|jgi:hypothetical protein
MSVQEERREYPRAEVKWPVTLITPEGQIEGEIENFTPKGVFISCEEAPPLERSFRIVIKVPGRQTMNVAGQVIWSTVLSSDEGGARLGVGIHFTEISEDNLKFLRQVLEQSEEKQS